VSFDLNDLMKQAQEMQKQVQDLQQQASAETVTATAGGGMVTVVATAGGEIKEVRIDPKAIDPDDPEMLGDLVTAAVNEALRNGHALLESKLGEVLPTGLQGLLPGL
jgi:DNA-binding YbaB/EbfC family protein